MTTARRHLAVVLLGISILACSGTPQASTGWCADLEDLVEDMRAMARSGESPFDVSARQGNRAVRVLADDAPPELRSIAEEFFAGPESDDVAATEAWLDSAEETWPRYFDEAGERCGSAVSWEAVSADWPTEQPEAPLQTTPRFRERWDRALSSDAVAGMDDVSLLAVGESDERVCELLGASREYAARLIDPGVEDLRATVEVDDRVTSCTWTSSPTDIALDENGDGRIDLLQARIEVPSETIVDQLALVDTSLVVTTPDGHRVIEMVDDGLRTGRDSGVATLLYDLDAPVAVSTYVTASADDPGGAARATMDRLVTSR